MKYTLTLLAVLALTHSLASAGQWETTPQAVIQRNMTPKNPMELKQPAIHTDGGHASLWYAGYWGGQNLYLAQSESLDIWQQANIRTCVFEGIESSTILSSPCVIKDEQGYKMWFIYTPNWDQPATVGMATSLDGVKWDSSPLNPVLQANPNADDSGAIQDVSVLKVDQTWHMWYASKKKDHWKVEIYHATSTNGIDWQRQGKTQFSTFYPGLIMDPCVIKHDDGYVMFFVIIQGDHKPTLQAAFSEDGNQWRCDFLTSLENVLAPAILKHNNQWQIWFTRDGEIWSAKYKP